MVPKTAGVWVRGWAPELILAVLAGTVLLGFLGSGDLWGKREQRAAAEAIDTVRHGHWLIAQIQGRPRLEKPPLPRWTLALLLMLTGRQEEWVARLPGALSALGMVGLVHDLGRRLAGRSAGLASALVLTSFAFFVVESRQAGNDTPLAFFTTLALYAAWRRLEAQPEPTTGAERCSARWWTRLMYVAMGLGVLTKGPIIVLLVAIALMPTLFLLGTGRRGRGARALADGWGLLLFLLLALSWPVPVLLRDPRAARIWFLEMAQKTIAVGVKHPHPRQILALDAPWMSVPWSLVALAAVSLPFWPGSRALGRRIWFPWWWSVGNLAMFCFWRVAKPSYYLPCLPGLALLTGIAWMRLAPLARGSQAGSCWARAVLQTHWVLLFVSALAAPVVVGQLVPRYQAWAWTLGLVVASAVVASVWAWRRGADVAALVPLVAALAVGVLVGYGAIVPAENPSRGYRRLAQTLDHLVPPQERTVLFFRAIDEGLWFYLRDHELQPVPGSQPRYNTAFDRVDELRHDRQVESLSERWAIEKRLLLAWLQGSHHPTHPYLLLRAHVYDQLADDLTGLAIPLYREYGLRRNAMVLLRVSPLEPVALRPASASR
jgi:4-amino-4-deoxy-L-arabinose transferase-like glycosyltransferase